MPRQVLLAEDHRDIRGIIHESLDEAGFAVESANDGVEALARARERPPDTQTIPPV